MSGSTPVVTHYPNPDRNLPFPAAVRVGSTVYLSGQIGVLPDGSLPEGIEAQSRQMFSNMANSAELAGITLHDIVKCTIMLADIADWPAFNAVYLEHFDHDRLPARSAFAAGGLAFGALVEVEAMAIARD